MPHKQKILGCLGQKLAVCTGLRLSENNVFARSLQVISVRLWHGSLTLHMG